MRAIAKTRPVGMVHFDAHTDTNDRYFGEAKFTHGTPFRRAVEDSQDPTARGVHPTAIRRKRPTSESSGGLHKGAQRDESRRVDPPELPS